MNKNDSKKINIKKFVKIFLSVLGVLVLLLTAWDLIKKTYKSSEIQEGLLNQVPLVISQPNINGVFINPEQYGDSSFYLPAYCSGLIYLRSEITECLFSIKSSQTLISLDKNHNLEMGLKNTGDDKIIIDFNDLVLNLVNYSDFSKDCPVDSFVNISECGGGGEGWYFDASVSDIDLSGVLFKRIELKSDKSRNTVPGEYIILNPGDYIRLAITIHTFHRGVHWFDFKINYTYKEKKYEESIGKFFIADESEQELEKYKIWVNPHLPD